MFVETWLLTGAILVAVVTTKRAQGSPLVISIWVLCGSIALLVLAPVGFAPMSLGAGAIVGIGIISLASPTFFSDPPNRMTRLDQGDRDVAFVRLAFFAAITLVMVLIGFRAFTTDIAAASGQNFDQLSITQIRRAQTGVARGGGLFELMGSMGPVLACLGLYGTLRYSRWWLVLSALALGISLQSPSRLDILSLIVVLAVFYLYVRRFFGKSSSKLLSRRYYPLLIFGGAGLGALMVFNSIGSKLGKNQSAARFFPQYNWPEWTLNPFVYFSGGFAALSRAIKYHFDPFDQGGSYFSLVRVVNVFFPDIGIPNTIGGYVGIPWPINIYTGFGNAYFDLGILGVILLFALLGWIAVVAHRRAMEGQVEWAWVSAVVASVLLTLPQGYHLFNLDIDFRLLIGFWIFWAIRRSKLSDRPRTLDLEVSLGTIDDSM